MTGTISHSAQNANHDTAHAPTDAPNDAPNDNCLAQPMQVETGPADPATATCPVAHQGPVADKTGNTVQTSPPPPPTAHAAITPPPSNANANANAEADTDSQHESSEPVVAIARGKLGLVGCIFLSADLAKPFLDENSQHESFDSIEEARTYLNEHPSVVDARQWLADPAHVAPLNTSIDTDRRQQKQMDQPNDLARQPFGPAHDKTKYGTPEQITKTVKKETLMDQPSKFWWDMYTFLLTFHKHHGHLVIRPDKSLLMHDRILGDAYVPLLLWIAEQRAQYQALLNSSSGNTARATVRVSSESTGPTATAPSETQRQNRDDSAAERCTPPTSMKIDRLNKLGFSWTVTTAEIEVSEAAADHAETAAKALAHHNKTPVDIDAAVTAAVAAVTETMTNDSIKSEPAPNEPLVAAALKYARSQSILDSAKAATEAQVAAVRRRIEPIMVVQGTRKVHTRWCQMWNKLREFKERHGHMNVNLAILELTGELEPLDRRKPSGDDNDVEDGQDNQAKDRHDDSMDTDEAVAKKPAAKLPTDALNEGNKAELIEEYRHLKVWVDNQRRFYREWVGAGRVASPNSKGTFCVNKEAMMKSIGFDLNADKRMYRKPGLRWESAFAKLKEYAEQNDGDFDISKAQADKDPKLHDLRRFIAEQQTQYRYLRDGQASTMSEEKQQRLQSIGFPLEHFTFEERLQQLKEHICKTGSKVFPKSHPLAKWAKKVKSQIQRFDAGKGCRITKEQVEQLKALGFEAGKSYEPVNEKEDTRTWEEHFETLRKYKEEHGNCLVNTNAPLNGFKKWVRLQRVHYRRLQDGKSTRLTAARLQKLYDIGFAFRQKPNYWSFKDRLEQLRAYKEKHGHTRVPVMEGALGAFVSSCRTEYGKRMEGRPNTMKDDRLKALQEIGFEFTVGKRLGPQNGRRTWEERFQQLLQFKAEHGHTVVPQHYTGYNNLGKWVQAQRKNYKRLRQGEKSSMTNERALQLSEIGFVWDASYKLKKQYKNGTADGDHAADSGSAVPAAHNGDMVANAPHTMVVGGVDMALGAEQVTQFDPQQLGNVILSPQRDNTAGQRKIGRRKLPTASGQAEMTSAATAAAMTSTDVPHAVTAEATANAVAAATAAAAAAAATAAANKTNLPMELDDDPIQHANI